MDSVTIATAALYFQRFFLAEKEEDFDASRVAVACVWLACKVREDARGLRDIANAFSALGGDGGPSSSAKGKVLQMEAYWVLRDDLVLHEQLVLRAMAFDTEPTRAYACLAELAWLLGCGPAEEEVLTLAWALLNDAFCGEVCALCAPARLAAACLLLAVEFGRRAPPASGLRRGAEHAAAQLDRLGREPKLEDYLGLGAESGGAEVEEICRDLLSLYEVDRRHPAPRSPSSEDL